MKLEVGEVYLTEDGRIIKITENKQKDLFLDSDDYFYNEIGVNDIINTNRNLIAHIPKELHYRICELINDYHTNNEVKEFIDNNYEDKFETKGLIIPVINAKKLCNKHGFYNSLESPRGCPQCSKQYNKQYTATLRAKDRQKIYNSKQWRDVRELALLRDCLLCQVCLKNNIQTKANEVHHIEYLEHRIDLAYDLDNLISLCSKCHQSIHSKD